MLYCAPVLIGCRLGLAIRWYAQCTSLGLGLIHVCRYSNVGGATDVGTPGISTARKEAISDAKRIMMGSLQKLLTAANGGIVMANGVSMYGGANADPRYTNSSTRHHNLIALEQTNAIMNEHTAVFECVNARNNSFNVETVAQDLQALVDAAHLDGGSKTVFVQTWPGMYGNFDIILDVLPFVLPCVIRLFRTISHAFLTHFCAPPHARRVCDILSFYLAS